MNINDIYLDALKELGYTETEARFLYIVGTHSGYFTSQQYLNFAEAKRGYESYAFRSQSRNVGSNDASNHDQRSSDAEKRTR